MEVPSVLCIGRALAEQREKTEFGEAQFVGQSTREEKTKQKKTECTEIYIEVHLCL